jgi:AcrR family transcriptional regulator
MSSPARPKKAGLRERKKQRTRKAIIHVAFELFEDNGYQATTLADIAEQAEISPSTLYTYFRVKDDILLYPLDDVIAAARARLLERPESEALIDALQAWVESLPTLIDADTASIRRRRMLLDGDPMLEELERMRLVRLEDIFAEAFSRDLGETADDLRSRLMASVTLHGLRAIWFWWYRHRSEGELDVSEPFALDATYLTRLVRAAEIAVGELPMFEGNLPQAQPST